MKIISTSLYGTGNVYKIGALANALLAQVVYPDWLFRVYAEKDHPAIPELIKLKAHVVERPAPSGVFGMSWRFEAVSDPQADYVIVRDIDSRLNVREKAAVDAWIDSSKTGHIMRDHPNHTHFSDIWKIFGGMWGIRGGIIKNIKAQIDEFNSWNNRADDMAFLTKYVWPVIEKSHLAHGLNGEPWPAHPPYQGFVGQRFDENNKGLPD
jgi:hypothetical protein